jgi:hypothetical protein
MGVDSPRRSVFSAVVSMKGCGFDVTPSSPPELPMAVRGENFQLTKLLCDMGDIIAENIL